MRRCDKENVELSRPNHRQYLPDRRVPGRALALAHSPETVDTRGGGPDQGGRGVAVEGLYAIENGGSG